MHFALCWKILEAMGGGRWPSAIIAGVDGSRWVSRSSKPLPGQLPGLGRVRLPRTPATRMTKPCPPSLPSVVLFYASSQPFFRPPSINAFQTASLHSYEVIFRREEFWIGLKNKLVLIAVVPFFTILFSAVISWIVVRTKARRTAASTWEACCCVRTPTQHSRSPEATASISRWARGIAACSLRRPRSSRQRKPARPSVSLHRPRQLWGSPPTLYRALCPSPPKPPVRGSRRSAPRFGGAPSPSRRRSWCSPAPLLSRGERSPC